MSVSSYFPSLFMYIQAEKARMTITTMCRTHSMAA